MVDKDSREGVRFQEDTCGMAIFEFAACFKDRWRLVAAMQYEQLMIIAVFVAQVMLLAWQLNVKKQVIIDDLGEILEGLIEDLDGRLAEAIQSVVQNVGMGAGEGPNPFQQLIAQYLQLKMTENVPGAQIVMPRGEDGKFESTPKDDKGN